MLCWQTRSYNTVCTRVMCAPGHTRTCPCCCTAFRAGIDAAVAEGNTAARVDNSIGLGNLWKMAGQYIKVRQERDEGGSMIPTMSRAGKG